MSAVALEDMKAYLKIDGDTEDAVLQSVLDAAERVIAGRVGPLSETTVTERLGTGGGGLALSTCPIIELTSVGPIDGSGYDLDDLHVDLDSGVVDYIGGTSLARGIYDVVYTAGWAAENDPLPADLELAVKELVRHMWQSAQRGSSRRPGSPVDGVAASGFLIPNAVASLLQAYTLPGFA